MGQYLAIGIATEISCAFKNRYGTEFGRTEIEERLKEEGRDMDLYVYDEKETSCHLWNLKPEALKSSLLPLLEALYPDLKQSDLDSDEDEVLEKLRSTPADQWLEIARQKSYISFQWDEYGQGEGMDFPKKQAFDNRHYIEYTCIMLAAQGKISTEGIGGILDFLIRQTRKVYAAYPLSGSLRAYITG